MSRSRIEILTSERERRISEVEEYETTLAILLEALGIIGEPLSGSHLDVFKQHLEQLVEQNRVQLQKSQIMLQALEKLIAKELPKVEH